MQPSNLKFDRLDMLLCLLGVFNHFPKLGQLRLGLHEVSTESIVLILLKGEAVSQLLQTRPELFHALWGLAEHINLNVKFIDVLEPLYFLFRSLDAGCFSLFLRAKLRQVHGKLRKLLSAPVIAFNDGRVLGAFLV